MSDLNCVVKGCNNKRYKDKHFCEDHWKRRRNKPGYKGGHMR